MKEIFLSHIFSDSDKERCLPIIDKIIGLVNIARQSGILHLESSVRDDESFLLRQGIALIVDGTDPALVRQILQNLILADKYSGFGLLSRMVIMEGVLAIQQGENPGIIALKLSSMLGEKYASKAAEALNQTHLSHDSLSAKFSNADEIIPASAQIIDVYTYTVTSS